MSEEDSGSCSSDAVWGSLLGLTVPQFYQAQTLGPWWMTTMSWLGTCRSLVPWSSLSKQTQQPPIYWCNQVHDARISSSGTGAFLQGSLVPKLGPYTAHCPSLLFPTVNIEQKRYIRTQQVQVCYWFHEYMRKKDVWHSSIWFIFWTQDSIMLSAAYSIQKKFIL